jgi:hypothetical protein
VAGLAGARAGKEVVERCRDGSIGVGGGWGAGRQPLALLGFEVGERLKCSAVL